MSDSQEHAPSGVPPAARQPLADRWCFVLVTGLAATVIVVVVTTRWGPPAARSDPAFLLVQVLKWGAFYFLLRWQMRARDPYAQVPGSVAGELRSLGVWLARLGLVVLAITAVWIGLHALFPSAYW